jgi:hypothetical protein
MQSAQLTKGCGWRRRCKHGYLYALSTATLIRSARLFRRAQHDFDTAVFGAALRGGVARQGGQKSDAFGTDL